MVPREREKRERDEERVRKKGEGNRSDLELEVFSGDELPRGGRRKGWGSPMARVLGDGRTQKARMVGVGKRRSSAPASGLSAA